LLPPAEDLVLKRLELGDQHLPLLGLLGDAVNVNHSDACRPGGFLGRRCGQRESERRGYGETGERGTAKSAPGAVAIGVHEKPTPGQVLDATGPFF